MATTFYATTPAISTLGRTGVTLSFWRWLGVEDSLYDHANIQVSTNGTSWTTVWDHNTSTIAETAWSYQSYDLSALADNKPAPPYWIVNDQKVAFDDGKYKANDEVPGIIIAPFAGDRGR